MLDLSRLGRRSYVSQNGLAEILKAVRDADTLPTGTSRSAVKRARQRAVAVQTPYGSLVKEWHMKKLDGTQVAIKYLCPAATLWQTLQKLRALQRTLGKGSRRKTMHHGIKVVAHPI